MKFDLIVKDASASDVSRILALLGGSTAVQTAPAMPQQAAGDEGDEGPTNANAPTVDSAGMPWDERIHAKTKAMTEAGAWRKRRGVSEQTIASVEAELKARTAGVQTAPQMPTMPAMPDMTQPQPVAMPTMPQMPVAQPGAMPTMPTMPAMPDMTQQPAPQPVAMPTMPVPQPAPQPQAFQMPQDFNGFMALLTGQMAKRDASGAPLIDNVYLANLTQAISTAFGTPLDVITSINGNPNSANMITWAVQKMNMDGKLI